MKLPTDTLFYCDTDTPVADDLPPSVLINTLADNGCQVWVRGNYLGVKGPALPEADVERIKRHKAMLREYVALAQSWSEVKHMMLTYGQHLVTCPAEDGGACDCGFGAARAKVERLNQ